MTTSYAPLLVPGATYWRKESARRLSLISDAGPTFTAMAAAMEAAERTIFILGWDIDSRTVLRPDASDPAERALLPLLRRCLERRPDLHIFVLAWDFSFIYSFEREPRPRHQFGRAHPRLHFSLDADHQTGGSHHQKVVVIDDDVAFVGGIDLTLHRWDTPDHAPIDRRRVDASGALYDPFHDVDMAVSGPAAAALGELARTRWQGERRPRRPVPPPLRAATDSSNTSSAWPPDLAVDAVDIDVALARTLVRPDQPPIKEIESLTLNTIAAAERWIYAENQYLTSGAIVRALGQRLEADTGPEIVLLLPQVESGWMEQSSMGILRAEATRRLLQADRHGRLRLLTPVVSRNGDTRPVAVHAKVLVADDLVAKVGSSNFSNRSLGLDSECDLVVVAYDEASAAFVASVRNRLLAEHMGLPPGEIAARLGAHGSLRRLVDEHPASSPRALLPTPTRFDAPFDFTVLDGVMVDPPEPWNMELLFERAVPVSFRRRLARRWMRPVGIVAAVLLAWILLRQWDPGAHRLRALISRFATTLAAHPAGTVIAIVTYAIAAAAFIPVTLLATVALTVFGMWPGVAIAWTGGVLGATLSHTIGGRLGPRVIAWLPHRIETRLRRLLTRRAFWSVVFIRMLPVGNFAVLNLMAGAVGVAPRSFVLGNMVGLLPGLVGLGVVVDRVVAAVRRPSMVNLLTTLAVVGLLGALGVFLKRRFLPSGTSH